MTSRRGAEELILEGRVTVNDALVTELPCFVDSGADEVRVDGRTGRGVIRKGAAGGPTPAPADG